MTLSVMLFLAVVATAIAVVPAVVIVVQDAKRAALAPVRRLREPETAAADRLAA